MRNFLKIAEGVDTLPVLMELNRAPDLWDQNRSRTTYKNTPHAAASDIWVRFRPADEITGTQSFVEPYRCHFWPAWHRLPSLRPLVALLKSRVDAVELGSILITRIAPGAAIEPHADVGGWSPEFYNTKLHVTLAGSSFSRCGEDAVVMVAGDVWTFDNRMMHSVENHGDCDRIVCIVSMRTEI